MPTNTKVQQTLEPVHVRADQSTNPAAAQPVAPSSAGPSKPAPPAAQPTVSKAQPSVKKPPKQAGSNVTMAIISTVIIVLGLAALAVLAYVKTKK
jgi:hypothetical protein